MHGSLRRCCRDQSRSPPPLLLPSSMLPLLACTHAARFGGSETLKYGWVLCPRNVVPPGRDVPDRIVALAAPPCLVFAPRHSTKSMFRSYRCLHSAARPGSTSLPPFKRSNGRPRTRSYTLIIAGKGGVSLARELTLAPLAPSLRKCMFTAVTALGSSTCIC